MYLFCLHMLRQTFDHLEVLTLERSTLSAQGLGEELARWCWPHRSIDARLSQDEVLRQEEGKSGCENGVYVVALQ